MCVWGGEYFKAFFFILSQHIPENLVLSYTIHTLGALKNLELPKISLIQMGAELRAQ